MDMQGTKDGLNNLEKKKNYGGFTFLHFKIYYKATLLGKKKTEWNWAKGRNVDQIIKFIIQ